MSALGFVRQAILFAYSECRCCFRTDIFEEAEKKKIKNSNLQKKKKKIVGPYSIRTFLVIFCCCVTHVFLSNAISI